MKHNLLFKLIAILLCAVSLFGILGGSAGALVLAQGDLYNRTVDQMLDEQLQQEAAVYADQAALKFASRELGSCPEEMLQTYFVHMDCASGYAIVDAEGNVLESLNPELKDKAVVYSTPVSGQYMHLVDLETETQLRTEAAEQRMADLEDTLMTDLSGNTVPPEGIAADYVTFLDAQGRNVYEAYYDGINICSTYFYYNYTLDNGAVDSFSHEHMTQTSHAGFLFCNAEGSLIYTSLLNEAEKPFCVSVYGLMLRSADQVFTFQSEDEDGLGTLCNESGRLTFTAFPAVADETAATGETVPEETVAETAPEETIAETLPPETVPVTEATLPPETYVEAETQAPEEYYDENSSASAVPEDYQEYYEETAAAEAPPETLPPETVAETVPETLPPETVAETIPEETVPEVAEPITINGKSLEFYQINRTEYHDADTGEHTTARYVYLPLPELTVEVYADHSTLSNAEYYNVLRVLREFRGYLLPVIGISLLVFALSAVYLCTAAGRKPKAEEVRAGGLNRMPLDLYLILGCGAGIGVIGIAVTMLPMLLNSDLLLGSAAAAGAGFLCCLLFVGFCFAFVAQSKTPGGFWWRNLLGIRFVFLCMGLLQWLERWLREKGLPWCFALLKKIWQLIMKAMIWLYKTLERAALWVTARMERFFSLIPVTWQWIICGMTLFCLLLLAVNTNSELLTLLCLAASFALILYGAHCFGVLLESTKKMGKGDLDTKVEDKLLLGSFKEFAGDLNNLADVAVVAAQKQLKSERMKTELITNVSHDIKTPLTSIINYVDLLQKPHTEEEAEQYLEVLDRQSQRLKKLIEDLMDMSKASTGNMAVEITRVDAVESVNQALGEFADKLDRANLFPVFRHKAESVPMMADGKLVWRVLSNLLGNAVKYAMPGTRIYLDLSEVGGKVALSIKNISREELNVDAEELMERFVRGDVSRNTEGSGLGLNIAKSLMELQKGQLQLLVDGDLFKVTLLFPGAK